MVNLANFDDILEKTKNEKVEKIYFDVKCLFHLVSTLFYEVYMVFAYYNRI